MRAIGLILLLCSALVGCGGTAATVAPAGTVTPTRSAILTTARVLTGLLADGTVRIGDTGAKTEKDNRGIEGTVLILYVGPQAAGSIATAGVYVTPPGTDMAALRDSEIAGLTAAEYASKSGRTPDFRVAQDRNVLVILSFLTSPDREADRATVEAALRAIP